MFYTFFDLNSELFSTVMTLGRKYNTLRDKARSCINVMFYESKERLILNLTGKISTFLGKQICWALCGMPINNKTHTSKGSVFEKGKSFDALILLSRVFRFMKNSLPIRIFLGVNMSYASYRFPKRAGAQIKCPLFHCLHFRQF